MRRAPYFVTGTDTEIGKTFIAAALLELARDRGLRCAALKPVAAGCAVVDGELVNDDALQLIAASGTDLDYRTVNPIALEPAIAPHIAAAQAGIELNAAELSRDCLDALAGEVDFAIIEGAGGWFVPLNATETLADVCLGIGARPILAVGMKLGCLNHALLTARAIAEAGGELAGWVANCPTPEMAVFEENVATLRERLMAPCLGGVPYLGSDATYRHAAPYLDLDPLLR
ncbi:MAG: dethiobiotin synthase [Gammaproteobacteria bacterium]|nr:dethiobiotin synthase [Gammaproteobacteria bacterium]